MADLKEQSGLPIELSSNELLVFDDPGLKVEPAIRKAGDMKEVIYQYHPDMAGTNLYYMYRDIAYENDRANLKKYKLRYDITIMSPLLLGRELNKTKGHYHPKLVGKEVTYPEVYEVIYGQAWYLIQRPAEDDSSVIEENYLVKVSQGEKIVVPPGFGHVTINPSLKQPLVMSNWVSRAFESEYEDYLKHSGASYYLLEDDQEVRNESYNEVPSLERIKPVDLPDFGLISGRPAYEITKTDIKRLDFLNNPDKYDLSIAKLFDNE